jgi:membrane protein DedA with SNARE-associated domain
MIVPMLIGVGLGSYLGYARGYRHGQKTTNAWWIEKQSRYYDSYEVEKKRQDRGFNAF